MNPQKEDFSKLFAILVAAHISRVNCDETPEDRPRQLAVGMKFLALNANISSPNAEPLGSKRSAHASVRERYPSKKWLYY